MDAPAHQIRGGELGMEAAMLAEALDELRARALAEEGSNGRWIERVDASRRASARNLLHYIALRRVDLRPIQPRLSALGLSSLGRAESCVLSSLDAVRRALAALAGEPFEEVDPPGSGVTPHEGRALLDEQTERLLGPRPARRRVRVMVTMPTQAADAPDVTRECLAGGMDVMRINGAHDGPERWARMIEHLRAAERALGRACRVQIDLPGPKIRTGPLADPDEPIPVRLGDPLKLVGPDEPCRIALRNAEGEITHPARVGCSAPEALEALAEGDVVWFDDGKFGAVVRRVKPGSALLEVTHASPKGALLRADKGINLPQTAVPIETPTPADLEILRFAAARADLVAMSFVRSPREVDRLRGALADLGEPEKPILLKVETRQAFDHLPELLLALMRSPVSGVMIARGDLAVECGWERLAEAQEEILWMCEAAHMPVVWATQVLESLAKKGKPTRSEVTDAAMAERAECVMLNKGPFIVRAMRALDDILGRMEAHQDKKRSELRALGMARAFGSSGP